MIDLIKGFFAKDRVLDAAINGLDAVWQTAEEKAEWVLKYLEATKHQSPTRRFIALGVFSLWSFLLVSGWIFSLAGLDSMEQTTFKYFELVNPVFGIVVAFYFVTGLKK